MQGSIGSLRVNKALSASVDPKICCNLIKAKFARGRADMGSRDVEHTDSVAIRGDRDWSSIAGINRDGCQYTTLGVVHCQNFHAPLTQIALNRNKLPVLVLTRK